MDGAEQRQYPRFGLGLPVKLHFSDAGIEVGGELQDISRGGCFFKSAVKVDVDRVEHLGERHSDAVQIGLVVPHPDRVPLVAIDHGHLDRFRADTELVQGARRAHRAPQPREPAAQNEDARRHRLVRSPIWRSTVWMTSKPSNSGCPR